MHTYKKCFQIFLQFVFYILHISENVKKKKEKKKEWSCEIDKLFLFSSYSVGKA